MPSFPLSLSTIWGYSPARAVLTRWLTVVRRFVASTWICSCCKLSQAPAASGMTEGWFSTAGASQVDVLLPTQEMASSGVIKSFSSQAGGSPCSAWHGRSSCRHKRPAVRLNLLCKVASELHHGIAARGIGTGTEGLVCHVLADRVLQSVTPLTQRESSVRRFTGSVFFCCRRCLADTCHTLDRKAPLDCLVLRQVFESMM